MYNGRSVPGVHLVCYLAVQPPRNNLLFADGSSHAEGGATRQPTSHYYTPLQTVTSRATWTLWLVNFTTDLAFFFIPVFYKVNGFIPVFYKINGFMPVFYKVNGFIPVFYRVNGKQCARSVFRLLSRSFGFSFLALSHLSLIFFPSFLLSSIPSFLSCCLS